MTRTRTRTRTHLNQLRELGGIIIQPCLIPRSNYRLGKHEPTATISEMYFRSNPRNNEGENEAIRDS